MAQIVGAVSQKPLNAKGGGVLYNCAAAPRAPTFAILPFHLPPQPSHFQIHTRSHRQSQNRSERWPLRRELETRRRRPLEPAATSGCRRSSRRRRSIGWWKRAFSRTVSLSDGGRPASSEPFIMPHTDEAVVFEDYFWRGLGFPVHPFLRDLLEFWRVNLCYLHPNTILHISIFIHFCEAYL